MTHQTAELAAWNALADDDIEEVVVIDSNRIAVIYDGCRHTEVAAIEEYIASRFEQTFEAEVVAHGTRGFSGSLNIYVAVMQ